MGPAERQGGETVSPPGPHTLRTSPGAGNDLGAGTPDQGSSRLTQSPLSYLNEIASRTR